MRVLALTGVPGTGKTTIASHLDDEIAVREANEIAREVDAIEGEDEQREATLVDERRLHDEAPRVLPEEGPVLVEGHLAHHVPADAVVLLRCHPDELRRRLESRSWPPEKVEENAMAETLDALVPEIDQRPAREVDTTDRDPEGLAVRIKGLFTGDALDEPWLQPLGSADWTDTLAGEDVA